MGAMCGTCAVGQCTDAGTSCIVWEAALPSGPATGLQLDDANAYVIVGGTSSKPAYVVYAINRTTAATTPLAQGSASIRSMTSNSTHLFWSVAGAIMRLSKTGGAVELLANVGSATSGCNNIVATENYVLCPLYDNPEKLMHIQMNGTVSTILVGYQPDQVRVDGNRIYYLLFNAGIGYALDSGGEQFAFENDPDITFFDVFGGHVYWQKYFTKGIFRKPVDGGTSETFIADSFGLFTTTAKGVMYLRGPESEIRRLNADKTLSPAFILKSDKLFELTAEKLDDNGYVMAGGSFSETDLREIRWNK